MDTTLRHAMHRKRPITAATRIWAGRVITGIATLFLAFDTVIKLFAMTPAVDGTTQLGYPASLVVPIGIIELGCLVVYLIPRTSIIGAVLLTGYLGGAIATHVRIGSPLATHVLFPIYVAVLIWGGMYLLDGRVRVVLQSRTQEASVPRAPSL